MFFPSNFYPNRIAQIMEPLIQWLKPFEGRTGQVFPKEWKKP